MDKQQILLKLKELLSNAILGLSTNELVDHDIIINPLTFNEVKLGIRETESLGHSSNGDRGLVAHP
ncbi:hypothetical protein ACJVC5_14975 [Peredibacter sp. HCB2-198]|uniref:hypothetical protein n=1 Tax=Peredibacter sp. HCB2-198 TaxID=3383025 RepID=UPI0038B68637